MSRVIHTESAGKTRTQLSRSVVLALRELMRQPEINSQTRDLAAYIALALQAISKTIDPSVEAWEKRGYWLKADRFRLEWDWAGRLGGDLQSALRTEDWSKVAVLSAQVAEKMKEVKLPQRHRLGTPWAGAWAHLNDSGFPAQLAGS